MMARSVRMWLAVLLIGLWGTACGATTAPTAAPAPTKVPTPTGTAVAGTVVPSPTSAPTSATSGATLAPLSTPAASVSAGGGSPLPTLRILAPQDGAEIALPAQVRYEIVGFAGGLPTGVHLHAVIGNPADGYRVELELAGLVGVATLPDDKSLPGRRDLTFVLAQPDHTPFANPQASVIIRGLVITGRR